ncbi:MAG TPA: ATP-binding protein [Puia sp.]|nr:ATP-binding protein [Puia sp.]
MLKKIVVIGPESTGKSTLCQQLAAYYQTDWVPEYAREYLHRHGMGYKYEDLLTIARGQLELEDARAAELEKKLAGVGMAGPDLTGTADEPERPGGAAGQPLLFIDTDMYVMKVWSEFVFGNCDPWILNQILNRRYDGYLLCRTDLPWENEELREYPDPATREKLFHIYRDSMINQHTPWTEIGGEAEQRLNAAIKAVNKLIRVTQTP